MFEQFRDECCNLSIHILANERLYVRFKLFIVHLILRFVICKPTFSNGCRRRFNESVLWCVCTNGGHLQKFYIRCRLYTNNCTQRLWGVHENWEICELVLFTVFTTRTSSSTACVVFSFLIRPCHPEPTSLCLSVQVTIHRGIDDIVPVI